MSNSTTTNVSNDLLCQLQSTAKQSGRDDLVQQVSEAIQSQISTPAVAWYVKVEAGHNELFFEEVRAKAYVQACRDALRTAELIAVPGQAPALAITGAPVDRERIRIALERLVALWDRDECIGSPDHDHQVPGKWDGDAKHPKGSTCLECEAYTDVRALLQALDGVLVGQSPSSLALGNQAAIFDVAKLRHDLSWFVLKDSELEAAGVGDDAKSFSPQLCDRIINVVQEVLA